MSNHDVNEPISMWGYFWYQVLFAIPVVGFVFLIVKSFSRNINVRNFARSYFCAAILALIFIAIVLACGGGAALFNALSNS